MAITTIDITRPHNNNVWTGNEDIVWATDGTGGDLVDISWEKGGVHGAFISVFRAHDNSPFSWDTSSVADGDDYTIRVRNNSDAGIFKISGVFKIDQNPPPIKPRGIGIGGQNMRRKGWQKIDQSIHARQRYLRRAAKR